MTTLRITLADDLVAQLDKVAPRRTQRRSDFISMAIRKALWEFEERRTAEAYARQPDSAQDEYVDPEVWES